MDIDPKDVIARLLIDHTDPDLISALHSFWKRHNLLKKEKVKVYQVILTSYDDADPELALITLDEKEARKSFLTNILTIIKQAIRHEPVNAGALDGYPLDGIYLTSDFDPESSNEWTGHDLFVCIKSFILEI